MFERLEDIKNHILDLLLITRILKKYFPEGLDYDKIYDYIPLPFTFWDERLSSRAMENFLIKEVDMSRAKRKKVLDSSSAAYILQGLLDALQYA